MSNSYWSQIGERRLSRRRALVIGAGAASGAAILAACGSGGGSGKSAGSSSTLLAQPADTLDKAKRGGILLDRTYADPPTLDIFTANSPLNAVDEFAYSALVQVKPGYMKPAQNEIVPDIAESWKTSPDGLQITLKLRQGVKWHNKAPVNGRVLDMDDILFSWDRFTRKSSGRAGIANVAAPNAPVLSITATDSKTFVMKLAEPIVYALALFSSNATGSPVIVPKETDGTFNIATDMIGTGPYMMTSYNPSVSFTFKRHPDYWDKDYALADQVEVPIISEYSAALSQLKAGHLYFMGSYASTPGVTAEDVLPLKREEPRIQIYQGDLARTGGIGLFRLAFGWLPAGKSPFADERVRQAVAMSWDRDLYLDTFYNVSQFASQGLPVIGRWDTSIASTFEGWWLDPKSKDFGPNSKYFQHDIAEAKKLLAAAGIPNGLPVTSNYITGPELGTTPKHAAVLDGMISDLGINVKANSIDYLKEYVPLYRDGHGQYDGWSYRTSAGAPTGGDATASLANEYWTKGGVSFFGFDTNGKGDQSGDPQVDSIIAKARVEQDTEKRRAMVGDVQRYLAKAMYAVPLPGVATGLTVAWPALGNFRVWQGARHDYRLWVDDTKAPLGKS